MTNAADTGKLTDDQIIRAVERWNGIDACHQEGVDIIEKEWKALGGIGSPPRFEERFIIERNGKQVYP